MRIGMYVFFGKQGFEFSEVISAFILGLRYDLRVVAIILVTMLVFGSIRPFNPFNSKTAKKVWMVLLGITSFILLFFYTVDFAHYSYLTQRLNASVLNYLEDTSISLNMVWQSYPVIRLILALLIGTVFMLWLLNRLYKRVEKKPGIASKKIRVTSFVFLFLLLGLAIFGKINQYPLRWSDAFALGSDYKANLALNPFESFLNSLKFRSGSYDQQKLNSYYPFLARYLGVKDASSGALNFTRTIAPKPGVNTSNANVVLVICESFSAYKSSMWGNPLNTTPFFDSISRKGLFFDRCFTPTYGTARGVWATITGIPDVETPTTASRNPLLVDQHTIVNDFTNHEKLYFLGGSTSWANIRGLLTNNISGLHLYEEEDYTAPKIDVWGISDKNLFLEANKVLAAQQKPFFAVIQTADNHRPYTIPEEDLVEFKKIQVPLDSLKKFGFESLEEMNAFRYTDFCFQKFMKAASNEKYFSNTVFVFIGDHGIPGDATAMFPKAWTDQRLAVEHVPLLYYAPGMVAPARSNKVCSQVDVLPTIAGILNIPYINTTLGRDLTDTTLTDHMAFIFDPDYSQTGVIREGFFYRRQLKTGKEEIVSILNNDDPQSNPEVSKMMTENSIIADALYQASKYMLLNNKKPKK